jgi:hypothetical protein
MKTIALFLLLAGLFVSCSDKNDDPIVELEVLRPIAGSTLQIDESAEIEVRFNSVETVEQLLLIINEQSIANPDTLLNQAVQQSGNFTLTHNHVFLNAGTVTLRAEAFVAGSVTPAAENSVDFNVQ